jgi:murein DD-endopeptidase MepM/ murein hydrolase activator NlpD
MKKLLPVSIIIILALIFSGAYSFADEQSNIQNKLKNTKEGIKDAKADYQEKKAEEKSLSNDINRLETSIAAAEKKIKDISGKISANNKKIEKVSAEVAAIEADVGKQDSELMGRLRLMYTGGESSIFEVLLDSKNIVDFMTNLDMIQKIHEQDIALLDELAAKLDEVELKRAELVEIKKSLEEHKAAEKQTKNELAADKKELAVAYVKAQAETVEALEELESLQAASKSLENELKKLKSRGSYGGGRMGWPVNGTVTSEFGWRVSPTSGRSQLHAGIDIAAPSGTPVYAAADGVVYSADWNSGGYGNLILIDHGSGIVTAYAHNSSLAAGAGQSVKRGDVIAYVGSTGDSTGPHCHFEVRVNGAPQNPRAWL